MSAKGDPKLMETFEKTEAKLAADQAKLKDIEKDLVAKQQQVLNDRGAYTRTPRVRRRQGHFETEYQECGRTRRL